MAGWEWTEERGRAAAAHFPRARAAPANDTFEVAISCAGATSTAAYTAGVLDFLFEALDQWHDARARDPASVPDHHVLVRALVGTSGGGMALAIAAAHATRTFPAVRHEDVTLYLATRGKGSTKATQEAFARLHANPFFATWVMGVDVLEGVDPVSGAKMPGLLTPGRRDGDIATTPSLLNCDMIDTLADGAIIGGAPKGANAIRTRAWLANPLEVRLTTTNLNGVPYSISFGGSDLVQTFLLGRDEMAFGVETGGTRPSDLQHFDVRGACPPDCLFLGQSEVRTSQDWRLLGQSAMATGALPIVLRERKLLQDKDVYVWRTLRHEDGDAMTVWAPPWWTPEPGQIEFKATDGGFTHDPPFEHARKRLAGLMGRNPREGDKANRALLLIDPLLGTERRRSTLGLMETMIALISAPMEQARLDAIDDMRTDDTERVYSRFMISPRRSHPSAPNADKLRGSFALVASGARAFLGFLHIAYRAHDFLLGRRNAQKFLRDAFAVPASNSIIARWSPAHRRPYAEGGFQTGDGRDSVAHYQIIPLVGSARQSLPAPNWPIDAIQLKSAEWKRIKKLIGKRSAVYASALAEEFGRSGDWTSKVFGPIAASMFAKRFAVKFLEDAITRVNDGLPAMDGFIPSAMSLFSERTRR
jgi:hypothetical protein